jgi:hypothetical protein
MSDISLARAEELVGREVVKRSGFRRGDVFFTATEPIETRDGKRCFSMEGQVVYKSDRLNFEAEIDIQKGELTSFRFIKE